MTLTETLDHLLSVFLRPFRTWIEREWVAPLRAAYDAAMQTKEQYRDGVYLHLRERLEGTDEHPLAEGVPVRPLPATQDLAHLQAAVELLADRKIEDAGDVPDGAGFLRILGDSTLAITELKDTNHGWTWNAPNDSLKNILLACPNVTKVTLNCKKVTSRMLFELNQTTREIEFHFNGVKELADGIIIGSNYTNREGIYSVYLHGFETCNNGTNGGPYIRSHRLYLPDYKVGSFRLGGSGSYSNNTTQYVYLGCKGEPTDTIQLWHYYDNSSVTDIEIRDGAKQPIILVGRGGGGQFVGLTEENIVNHIFNRLADNNDGDPITITLGSTNLAKLTDEEKHIAIDKNYILA